MARNLKVETATLAPVLGSRNRPRRLALLAALAAMLLGGCSPTPVGPPPAPLPVGPPPVPLPIGPPPAAEPVGPGAKRLELQAEREKNRERLLLAKTLASRQRPIFLRECRAAGLEPEAVMKLEDSATVEARIRPAIAAKDHLITLATEADKLKEMDAVYTQEIAKLFKAEDLAKIQGGGDGLSRAKLKEIDEILARHRSDPADATRSPQSALAREKIQAELLGRLDPKRAKFPIARVSGTPQPIPKLIDEKLGDEIDDFLAGLESDEIPKTIKSLSGRDPESAWLAHAKAAEGVILLIRAYQPVRPVAGNWKDTNIQSLGQYIQGIHDSVARPYQDAFRTAIRGQDWDSALDILEEFGDRVPGYPALADMGSRFSARIEAMDRAGDEDSKFKAAELRARLAEIGNKPGRSAGGLSSGATTGRKGGDQLTVKIGTIDVVFCWCPPTSAPFKMGSPANETGHQDDEAQVDVTISEGFWMMKTEMTQELYEALGFENKSHFKGPKLPVETIRHAEAVECAKRFTERLREANALPEGWEIRLPTEAQWEYAARAGSKSAFPLGDTLDASQANFGSNLGKTTDVGTYRPNDWGLVDTVANVWEWTLDAYQAKLPGGIDPFVAGDPGSLFMIRGGSWSLAAEYCRAASRVKSTPDHTLNYLGLRLARVPSR